MDDLKITFLCVDTFHYTDKNGDALQPLSERGKQALHIPMIFFFLVPTLAEAITSRCTTTHWNISIDMDVLNITWVFLLYILNHFPSFRRHLISLKYTIHENTVGKLEQ